MKRSLYLFILLINFSCIVRGQQYALFNTGTLFDTFENPAQKAFTLDYSKRYASNFLLPTLTFNLANKGTPPEFYSEFFQKGNYDLSKLKPLGAGKPNTFYVNSNIYLLTFRMFKSYRHHEELGFSWQIKGDANIKYTNETIAVLDTYQNLPENKRYDNIFNNKGSQQSYHQFSFTYRENYDKRISFGIKASLLSGIAYNNFRITKSSFFVDTVQQKIDITLRGKYRGSIPQDSNAKKTILPLFNNPGLSLGFGTTYLTKNGVFIMANIKDLGFIWWRSNPQELTLNNPKINDVNSPGEIDHQIQDIFKLSEHPSRFLAATNARADFLVSKTFGVYKPSLILSKNLFYMGGDAAWVNTINLNNYSASITPSYNFSGFFRVGLQGMYQTPNFEFFGGSDDLISSYKQAKGSVSSNGISLDNSHNGASFYMGIGIKFGRLTEHPQNSGFMPGIGNKTDTKGFFGSMFSIFK